MRLFTSVLAATIVLAAATASAQSPAPPVQPRGAVMAPPRFDVSAGASGQVTTSEFTARLSFPLYEETAEITGPVEPGLGVRLELGGGVRLWRGLSAGVQVTRASASGRMEATFSLPNPFLFSDPRSATIETSTSQSTTDVHLQARMDVLRRGRWSVTVFGGPSFTWLNQALALDRIAYTYVYPFDEITLTESGSGETSGQGTGGHVGFTVARQVHKGMHVTGLVRWNRTDVDLETALGSVIVQTGGLQIGGGLQFFF